MSEKLNLAPSQPEKSKSVPEQFTVDEKDYPVFSRQGIHESDGDKTLGINETLGIFVRNTADLISIIDGTGEDIDNPPADHVIYLDKSARPVSWLVNTFWSDFSDKERPSHSYLAVDRHPWMKYAGVELDSNDYIKDTNELARPKDFNVNKIPPEFIARIRAVFLKDGLPDEIEGLYSVPDPTSPSTITKEDIDKIMQSPTDLAGKNILIVDEVRRSGATLHIAEELIKKAIPEAKDVSGAYFVPNIENPNPETLQRFVPVWYDRDTHEGRGIGDVNPALAIERYKKFKAEHPEVSPRYRARTLGAFALGTAYDLSQDRGNKSREIMHEIGKMHDDYQEGKILMRNPRHYDFDKYQEWAESHGVLFSQNGAANTYISIVKAQESERK